MAAVAKWAIFSPAFAGNRTRFHGLPFWHPMKNPERKGRFPVSTSYTGRFHLSSQDIDCHYRLRPSTLLGFLQDVAAEAAAQFHATREEMVQKYNLFWMVARVRYQLSAPITWGQELTIQTWHRGSERTLMYRDYLLSVDGKEVGRATTVWVLCNLTTRKLERFSNFPEFEGTDGGELCWDTKVPHLHLPDELQTVERRQMHFSETDVNGHVNNTRYADFMCDALGDRLAAPDAFVSELQIGYLAECKMGDTLELRLTQADGRYYIQGLGGENSPRFEGYLVVKKP